ncbi:MAG: TA system VapC family ribonuclease toxin [Bryobacteraceae bacterium]|jgi:toxin-antitoxin system PIN domain toxin
MITVDTNILVYAHRRDSEWFQPASAAIRGLAEGAAPWSISWPSIHEFLAIVTNPRIYKPPTPLSAAIRQVEFWMESPTLHLIGELEDHWRLLAGILTAAKVKGGAIHDARIAAICAAHGVRELWTVDRDFSRFTGIRAVNPLRG